MGNVRLQGVLMKRTMFAHPRRVRLSTSKMSDVQASNSAIHFLERTTRSSVQPVCSSAREHFADPQPRERTRTHSDVRDIFPCWGDHVPLRRKAGAKCRTTGLDWPTTLLQPTTPARRGSIPAETRPRILSRG